MGDSSQHFVYFIQPERGGAVKIGVSSAPEKRLKQLKTASPDPLRILAVVPGSFTEEAALHRLFRKSRVRLEWFKNTPELREMITQCVDTGRVPVERCPVDPISVVKRRYSALSKEFGLQKWLTENQVKAAAMARALQVSPGTISMIARGLHLPGIELACKIDGFTAGQVTMVDHWEAWIAAHPHDYVQFRAEGRAAAKACKSPAKTRKK